MPRELRNFGLHLAVDGKARSLQTGPNGKDGGFTLHFLIREGENVSEKRLCIKAFVFSDGTLEIRADSDEPELRDKSITLLRGWR
jgi:hypothetical protein